jgi:Fe-S oxidoreductase
MGRYRGIYQPPRDLLGDLGCDVVEMEHNREDSICCGTSCWTSCGQVNKRTQIDRLQEARSSGAEALITACPKCQIHLKCAQGDPIRGDDLSMPIRDITTLLAEII